MNTQSKKYTVLVVEDDVSLLNALVDKFSREGFSVLEAKNGEEGLEIALQKHPDVILLDVVMPKMDGMTMLKRLRENEWGKTAGVIILTNLSELAKVSEAVTHGSFEYLVKSDWKIEDVVAKVKEHLKTSHS